MKININGINYIPENETNETNETNENNNNPYVIVRTYSAGVFAGNLDSRIGKEAVVLNARRLWYWAGAASLSQLSMEGTSKPDDCKFPCEMDRVELTEVIEIDYCTKKAEKSIKNVPVWEA